MRKKTCIVWKYFTHLNTQNALCKVCGRNVKYHRSNTNLRSHLRVWHREIWNEVANKVSNGFGASYSEPSGQASSVQVFWNLPQQVNFTSPQDNVFQLCQSLQILENSFGLESPNKGDEESNETEKTEDSGVAENVDDSDGTVDSKDAIAAQIEVLQQQQVVSNKSSLEENVDHNRFEAKGEERLIQRHGASLSDGGSGARFACSAASGNPDPVDAVQESNSLESPPSCSEPIAAYLKFCDGSTRQTFLDVIKSDKEQHLDAAKAIEKDIVSVSITLEEVNEQQLRKVERLEEVLREVSHLQNELNQLDGKRSKLSEQEILLKEKLNILKKKICLCDSALQAMNT